MLELGIGPVRCRVKATGPDSGHALFDIPRLPEISGEAPGKETIAAALSIAASDIASELPTERWSAGNPFTVVPVTGLDAIGRCRADP